MAPPHAGRGVHHMPGVVASCGVMCCLECHAVHVLLWRCCSGAAVGVSSRQLTFVIMPCMMRKWGLLTLSCTEWNRSCTRLRTQHTLWCQHACMRLASATGLKTALLHQKLCCFEGGAMALRSVRQALRAPSGMHAAARLLTMTSCSTYPGCAAWPLIMYLFLPPMTICKADTARL
jgi:hypothetical protein